MKKFIYVAITTIILVVFMLISCSSKQNNTTDNVTTSDISQGQVLGRTPECTVYVFKNGLDYIYVVVNDDGARGIAVSRHQ